MRTAISSAESRALPAGLRIHRRRGAPIWLGIAGLAGGGLVLGTVLSGAPSSAILGTVAVLIAAAAAIYWPALGLAILVFTYPFDLTTYAGPVKLTSSAALMGVLLLVLVGRRFLSSSPSIRRTGLDIPVVLFAFASVASLLSLTGNLSGQVVGLIKAFGGFGLFFLTTQYIRQVRDALLVIGSLIATGLVQALQTVIPFATGNELVSVDTRATGTLIDPNLFAGYLVLVIPLVVALGVALRQWWPVLPAAGATLVLAAALAVTLSRSGWLGLIAGAVVLWVLLRTRRWRVTFVLAAVAACMLLVGLSGPISARLAPSDIGPSQMLADRSQVWSAAVRMTLDHPIFGVGIDNFQLFYPVYSGRDDELNHAHNLFLNVAAERGMLGILSFGLVAFLLLKLLVDDAIRSEGMVERAVAVGLLATFVAYFVHSLFDVSYYDYKVLLLFWLLAGIAASWHALTSAEQGVRPTGRPPAGRG